MLFSATFSQSFSGIFDGMSLSALMCIIVGLMMIICEFFQSSKFLIGGCGAAVLLVGITLRMLANASLGNLFAMIFLIALILYTAHILVFFTQKKRWLNRFIKLALSGTSGVMRDGSYSYLVGLTGIATTQISLSGGNISLNGINFFVSSNEAIEKGLPVIVTAADSEKIIVKQHQSTGDFDVIKTKIEETLKITE